MAFSHKFMASLLLALAAAGAAAQSQSPFVLTFGDGGASTTAAAALGSTFAAAANPALDQVALTGAGGGVLITKTTLAPCVVRVMHIHRNVEELVYGVSGPVAVAAAHPNGTIYRDVLAPEQSFLVVRNWVHTVYNPDCKANATYLSIFNTADAATSNIAKAVFDINAGPFKPYTNSKFFQSAQNALGTFAYDPQCLARCRLRAANGQLPAYAPGGQM